MIIPALSLDRFLANVANSRKSTGPKSPAGKARSSRNAITHGLSANSLLAPGESPDRLYSHLALIHADLGPQSYLETILALRVGAATWRLFRCDSFESALIDNQLAVSEHADNTPGTVARAWAENRPDLPLRYHAAHQNSLHKTLQTFLGLAALRHNGALPDAGTALEPDPEPQPAPEPATEPVPAIESPATARTAPPPAQMSPPSPHVPAPSFQPLAPESARLRNEAKLEKSTPERGDSQ